MRMLIDQRLCTHVRDRESTRRKCGMQASVYEFVCTYLAPGVFLQNEEITQRSNTLFLPETHTHKKKVFSYTFFSHEIVNCTYVHSEA